jgi:hypothetical protein
MAGQMSEEGLAHVRCNILVVKDLSNQEAQLKLE